MPELEEDEAALSMNGVRHSLPACNLLRSKDTRNAGISTRLGAIVRQRFNDFPQFIETHITADRARLRQLEAAFTGSLRVVFDM